MSRRRREGEFPYFGADQDFPFPPAESADAQGIVCSGGNLSPGMLLSAYRRGIFPWYSAPSPILWWSPEPRFVLFPEELHVSASMRKELRKRRFEIRLDGDFAAVIGHCSSMPRPGQDGTWIVSDMIEAYLELHRLGYAHSVEAYLDGKLAGGLYGISLGRAFFGESMFHVEPNASKAAFIPFAWRLREEGFLFIDSQVHTDYLESLGARHITRQDYLSLLSRALAQPGIVGPWAQAFPGFPASKAFETIVGSRL